MATKLPMSEKAVDRVTRLWFVFGTNRETGHVDVSNGQEDVFTDLPPEIAVRVIEAHDKFREEMYSILCQPQEVGKV